MILLLERFQDASSTLRQICHVANWKPWPIEFIDLPKMAIFQFCSQTVNVYQRVDHTGGPLKRTAKPRNRLSLILTMMEPSKQWIGSRSCNLRYFWTHHWSKCCSVGKTWVGRTLPTRVHLHLVSVFRALQQYENIVSAQSVVISRLQDRLARLEHAVATG
jgi:hypothetical protein